MSETIVLEGDLATTARAEADTEFDGDIVRLTRQALEDYLALRRMYQQLATASPGEPEPQQLAAAVAGIPGLSLDGAVAAARLLGQALGAAPQVDEGSPQQFVNDLVNYLAAGGNNLVGATLISTQPPGGEFGAQRESVVSFARGWLRMHGNPPGRGLSGDLDQWFSDRTYGPAADPFDGSRREQIGLLVALDQTTGLVSVDITAHAWGDARQTLRNLRMDNGMLIGDGASVGNQSPSALYAVGLSRVVAPG